MGWLVAQVAREVSDFQNGVVQCCGPIALMVPDIDVYEHMDDAVIKECRRCDVEGRYRPCIVVPLQVLRIEQHAVAVDIVELASLWVTRILRGAILLVDIPRADVYLRALDADSFRHVIVRKDLLPAIVLIEPAVVLKTIVGIPALRHRGIKPRAFVKGRIVILIRALNPGEAAVTVVDRCVRCIDRWTRIRAGEDVQRIDILHSGAPRLHIEVIHPGIEPLARNPRTAKDITAVVVRRQHQSRAASFRQVDVGVD